MNTSYQDIVNGLKRGNQAGKQQAAFVLNPQLLFIYWEIGHTISEQQKAQGGGTKVIDRVAVDLKTEFPVMRGFSVSNIRLIVNSNFNWPNYGEVNKGTNINLV